MDILIYWEKMDTHLQKPEPPPKPPKAPKPPMNTAQKISLLLCVFSGFILCVGSNKRG